IRRPDAPPAHPRRGRKRPRRLLVDRRVGRDRYRTGNDVYGRVDEEVTRPPAPTSTALHEAGPAATRPTARARAPPRPARTSRQPPSRRPRTSPGRGARPRTVAHGPAIPRCSRAPRRGPR